MKLCPGILGVKPPMYGGSGGIALPFQGLDLPAEGNFVRDALPEAGASQNAKFYLRHVEPTAVLGCVVELQPFHDTPGLSSGEGFV